MPDKEYPTFEIKLGGLKCNYFHSLKATFGFSLLKYNHIFPIETEMHLWKPIAMLTENIKLL